jgi:hypothetical protein
MEAELKKTHRKFGEIVCRASPFLPVVESISHVGTK